MMITSVGVYKNNNQVVSEVGPRWTLVGSRVGRTGPQCSLRYRLSLDPRLKWRLWTKEEVSLDAHLGILC